HAASRDRLPPGLYATSDGRLAPPCMRPQDASGLQVTSGDRLSSAQRMGERSAVHIFELTTNRHPVRDAASANVALRRELAEEVGGRFTFHCGIGGEYDLAHGSLVEKGLQ